MYHGGGRRPYSRRTRYLQPRRSYDDDDERPRYDPERRRPEPPSLRDFLLGAGRSALTNAVLAGLAVSVPPVGGVAMSAYMAYNYASFGVTCYKAYRELQAGQGLASPSLAKAASQVGGFVSQGVASGLASRITRTAVDSGLVGLASTETGFRVSTVEAMIGGSLSSLLSDSSSEVLRLAITRAGTG
jgi:hypothetical protein